MTKSNLDLEVTSAVALFRRLRAELRGRDSGEGGEQKAFRREGDADIDGGGRATAL
jgi:hypothetical protein